MQKCLIKGIGGIREPHVRPVECRKASVRFEHAVLESCTAGSCEDSVRRFTPRFVTSRSRFALSARRVSRLPCLSKKPTVPAGQSC